MRCRADWLGVKFCCFELLVLLFVLNLFFVAVVRAENVFSGPGLGNLSYKDSELFKPLSRIDQTNGIPVNSPTTPFGMNIASMHDGYFFAVFAPNAGLGPGGFAFYDVSNPRNPKLASLVYEPFGRTSEIREAHSVGFYHAGNDKYVAIQTGRGIEFWNIKDINNPVQVSKLRLAGVNFGDYTNSAWQLFWQAPYLYVAASNLGLFIVDTSDIENPKLVNRGKGNPNPIPISETGGFRIGPVFALGNHLLITSMDTKKGYSSFDLSDPKNPKLLLSEPRFFMNTYYATCYTGDLVIGAVRGKNGRMTVHDIKDPKKLQILNQNVIINEQQYCAVKDELLFQGTKTAVYKLNISNPKKPRILGKGSINIKEADQGQVSIFGNLIFVGNDHGTGNAFLVHSKAPDKVPPKVRFVRPLNKSKDVAVTSPIGLSLSDNIKVETVNKDTFIVRPKGGKQLAGTYSVQHTLANFVPDKPLLPLTTYEVTVTKNGITDWAGNKSNTEFKSSFRTSARLHRQIVSDAQETKINFAPIIPTQAGKVVVLDAKVTPAGDYTYNWNLGDGIKTEPVSASRVQHVYKSAGHYQVTLTVNEGEKEIGRKSFIQTIYRTLAKTRPTHSSSIIYSGAYTYSVNSDNNSVSSVEVIDLRKNWERKVGKNPRTLAMSPKGEIWVTVQDQDSIYVLYPDKKDKAKRNIFKLKRGSKPYGIAFKPDGSGALVTLEGSGELVEIDLDGTVRSRLHLGGTPHAIAISSDSKKAYITNLISNQQHGLISVVDLTNFKLAHQIKLPLDSQTLDGEDRARGLPNFLNSIVISPDQSVAWVTGVKHNILRGLYRDGLPLTFDSTVRAITTEIDLKDYKITATIDHNNKSMPIAVAFSPIGDYAFIALEGSNSIDIRDAYSKELVGSIDNTGFAPAGLTFNSNGSRLIVHNFLSRNVAVYDTYTIINSTVFSSKHINNVSTVYREKLPKKVLKGKQLFFNAATPLMSLDGYLSCASCHRDNGHDGQVWDFTQFGEGLRNTISIKGKAGMAHGNLHWSANFDEVQDFEQQIRKLAFGRGLIGDSNIDIEDKYSALGLPKKGLSEKLDALSAYVSSLTSFGRSPYRDISGELTETAKLGEQVFKAKNCMSCHSGKNFTDSTTTLLHDVGTIKKTSGKASGKKLVGIDTPTLRGLWNTAPYFHDGSAKTLKDVFKDKSNHGDTKDLSEEELEQLISYLLQVE